MYKTVVSVDGMMCGMCESHVNDAVRNAFAIDKVTSSRKNKQTVIYTKEKLDEEKLLATIHATGYTAALIEVREEEKKGFLRKLFG